LPDGSGESVSPREEVDVFHDIHVRVLAETVRHKAHNAPHLVRVIDDRIPIYECLALRRNIERSQDPHRGRLARAVGADKPHHLARIRLERDAIDGAEPAKVPVQIAQFNRWRAAVPV